MQVVFEVEDIPKNHKPYIICRMKYGELKYYDSYSSRRLAQQTFERLEDAVMIRGE